MLEQVGEDVTDTRDEGIPVETRQPRSAQGLSSS